MNLMPSQEQDLEARPGMAHWKVRDCSHQSTLTVVHAGLARVICENCGDVTVRYESVIAANIDRSMFSREADSAHVKAGAHSKS